jgi:glycosyltransferase involved in cell wall biosynthesis
MAKNLLNFRILFGNQWLSNSKNGISRDTKAIFDSLKKNDVVSVVHSGIFEKSKFLNKVNRGLSVFKTVVTRSPRFVTFQSNVVFVPQIQNSLPKDKHSALIRIHDLFPLTNPEWFYKISVMVFRLTLFQAVKDGHTFLCNSEYTKFKLLEYFPDACVELLYCSPKRVTPIQCDQCEFCINKLAFQIPFYLAVGTIEPRKNYPKLIEVWNDISDSVDSNLLIIGRLGWKSRKTYKKLKQSRGLIHLENVCDFGVASLILKSEVFISCSFDEGFNYPVIDAALLNKRLLLSDIPVHRELYGESPSYFNPKDSNSIRTAMLEKKFRSVEINSKFYSNEKRFDEILIQIVQKISSRGLN